MKIVKVHVERTFNLGDYNSRKAGLDADLSDGEQPLEAMRELEMLLHQHNENMLKPVTTQTSSNVHTQAPAPTPKSAPQPKKETPSNWIPCRQCKTMHDPKYPLCYNCYMDEKGAPNE
jgi:hypothetical protein